MAADLPDDPADVKAVGNRFKVYLDREHKGNQSQLADNTLGISQPALSRVITGDQLPSGKLLLALSKKTNLNIDWLLTSRGEMLLAEGGAVGSGAPSLVVANQPLPGPPDAHAGLLSGEMLAGSGVVIRASQYYLRIQHGEPITGDQGQKVKEGDLVLLETDRAYFPAPDRIDDELWVVRLGSKGGVQYRLAEVTHVEGVLLWADTFDLDTKPEAKEIVLRQSPEGKYTVHERRLKPRRAPNLGRAPHAIKVDDLIARSLVIVRRSAP